MAFLITCCKLKNDPAINPQSIPSTVASLSFAGLLPWRMKLITALPNPLNWNFTLPAWMLYTGKLYSQVSDTNWQKSTTKVVILSALFGWLKHTDLIPYYDLRMTDTIVINGNKIKVWRYWLESQQLQSSIVPNDIDLLSQAYRNAIDPQTTTVCSSPGVSFQDRYGIGKGKWLNSVL